MVALLRASSWEVNECGTAGFLTSFHVLSVKSFGCFLCLDVGHERDLVGMIVARVGGGGGGVVIIILVIRIVITRIIVVVEEVTPGTM